MRTDDPRQRRESGWHRAPRMTMASVSLLSALTVGDVGSMVSLPATAAVSTSRSGVERTIKDPAIVESSGLARSHYRPSRLWTHNDSGGGSTIYALGRTGRTTARYQLLHASHLDWEGMASAQRQGVSYLFVGDIGDNGARRSSVFVHRVREPRPEGQRRLLDPTTFEFEYPDGAHNAETLMVRPGSMRIYIVTKGKKVPGSFYVAPRVPSSKRVNLLRRIGPAPAGMADGVFLDRHRFILRRYEGGWLYRRMSGKPVRFALPIKGESITKGSRAGQVLIGSEGRYSDIWRVSLP